jgi:hypothetical protein
LNPEFKAGVRKFFEVAYENAPIIIGAAGGAMAGSLVSPRERPGELTLPGAVMGAGLGLTRMRRWKRHRLHGVVS